MQTVQIESFAELLDALFDNSWNPTLGRFRSPFAFRGLSQTSYSLTTTLTRLGGDFAQMEPHILRSFRKYAPRASVEADSVFHWLALGQQHGLPTRLLDWTFSPFVALHFATADPRCFEFDSVVWAVHYAKVSELLPRQLKRELEQEGAELLTVEMLARAASDLHALRELTSAPFLLFFEPPALTERFINQFAVFSMMSDANAQTSSWFEQHSDLAKKIVIPARLKGEVRDKLDQANVTERLLAPGLDGLSAWLRRHYSPRRNDPVASEGAPPEPMNLKPMK
jgi:hypothetical protein